MGNSTSLPDAPDAPGAPTSPLSGLNRPPLGHRQSSTVTVKGGKRRKSIELPDLDPSLAFTSTPARPEPESPSAVRWGGRRPSARSVSSPKGSVGRSTSKASPTVSVAPVHAPSAVPGETSATRDDLTPTASALTSFETTEQPPDTNDDLTGPLPPLLLNVGTTMPTLHAPEDTIVAPYIPENVGPLPIGPGATQSTSLVVGSTQNLFPTTLPPAPTSPDLRDINKEISHPIDPPPVRPTHVSTPSSGKIPMAMPASAFPLSAESIEDASQTSHVPAAAPLATLTNLVNDPAGQEAVKNAIVDLGGGSDAVPTLLSWTPGERGENAAAPKSVYVTGTFAKGWKTKIEMRQKKYTFIACPGMSVSLISEAQIRAYIRHGFLGPRRSTARSPSAQIYRG